MNGVRPADRKSPPVRQIGSTSLAAIGKDEFPDPEELRVAWRLYFLAQFWRATQPLIRGTTAEKELSKELDQYGIAPRAQSGLKTAFAYALAKARALKNLDIKWTQGIAISFDEEQLRAGGSAAAIPFNDLLARIDSALAGLGKRVWLILDRLDEIVLGDEERENVVLKGLLLAFRDVCDNPRARVKVFLRDDVYDRVTSIGHFPALTHVRSKAAGPIKWESEDLLHLVVRRLLVNRDIGTLVGADADHLQSSDERQRVYYALFPEKVDKGRAAEGFKWIIDRITDGNGVATPRDLLSVIDAARSFQLEQFGRETPNLVGQQLFTEDTIRRAVRKVAKDNLETRIFAEYPDLRVPIRAFEGGKADHNEITLRKVLGANWEALMPRLMRVGFLYRRSRSGVQMWTIPFFYSFALDVTRGAAFDLQATESDEEL